MKPMDLFTEEQKAILFANSNNSSKEQVPVASLYYGGGSMDYRILVASVDPKDKCTAYGVCAFNGNATLQHFSLEAFIEIAENNNSMVLAEQGYHADRPLSDFLQVAKNQNTLAGLTNGQSPRFKQVLKALNPPA